MKQKIYKAEIIKRFLSREQQKDFEEKYQSYKIRALGRKIAKETK